MNPIRTIVVDDHVILRDGLVRILAAEPDFEIVGEAGSVAGALEAVRANGPDLVLLDYGLPDGTGLEATRIIKAEFPETYVVLLTVHEQDDLLFEAVRSGASGYLLKNISANELVAKLRGLSQGDAALSADQSKRILSEFARTASPKPAEQEDAISLTDRELEVLCLIVLGDSNMEIALALNISIYTVKNHVHNTLEKLEVNNRREAADVAVKRRLVKPRKR